MKLYIKTENGVTIEHPALEENLLDAFGCIPENWEPFLRVPYPTLPLYKTLEPLEPSYQKIDGVWTDVWSFRDMTPEEKLEQQAIVKNRWANRPQAENFVAWTFDETLCDFVPPIPKPTDGKNYFWQGATSSWIERPPYPEDGKNYRLNFTSGVWEEVTT